MDQLLIYGATGYTGKIITKMAVDQGLHPLLSGRDEDKLKNLADPLGLKYTRIDLSDTATLEDTLRPMDAVIHCAGPFSKTAAPMVAACLKAGTHYLDITGEIEVFEQLFNLDEAARRAGIMIMPGVGFDVVPTDCMAAYMKGRMNDASSLKLFIGGGMKGISPGTAKTAAESVGKKTLVRREGKITPTDPLFGSCDFGNGMQKTIAASWGDVSTAYRTTGIPDITVFFESNRQLEKMVRLNSFIRWLLSTSFVQKRIKKNIEQKVKGPSEEQRAGSSAVIIAEVSNIKGDVIRSRLRVPSGYTLTGLTALKIARQVSSGKFREGFCTPAALFGADFILQFDGVERQDLNGS